MRCLLYCQVVKHGAIKIPCVEQDETIGGCIPSIPHSRTTLIDDHVISRVDLFSPGDVCNDVFDVICYRHSALVQVYDFDDITADALKNFEREL